jgi:hypothetical protein
VQLKKAMKLHFWDLTESVITVRSLDIEPTNVPKRRTEIPEDKTTTTTTTTETFLEEDEVEAMVVIRTINLKETAITAESRDMPKQHAGCFPAMRARGPHGLSHVKMAQKPEQLPMRQGIKWNTS